MLFVLVRQDPVTEAFYSLAYAEMRLVLARMLWNFDMELHSSSLNWDDQKVCWVFSHQACSNILGMVFVGEGSPLRKAHAT